MPLAVLSSPPQTETPWPLAVLACPPQTDEVKLLAVLPFPPALRLRRRPLWRLARPPSDEKRLRLLGGGPPPLLPQKPGDRVKPERPDAEPWARLARSGALSVVSVRPVADDALRELARARADTRDALKSAQCRRNTCWRRHDSHDPVRAIWGSAHRRGLSAVVCPPPAQPIVFPDNGHAIHAHTDRLPRLDQALQPQVTSWHLPPVVAARQALRGGQFIAAVIRVAARGALTRFESPRARMQCLGLMPSADTRAARRRPGAMAPELAGFLAALATQGPVPPSGHDRSRLTDERRWPPSHRGAKGPVERRNLQY